MLVLIVAIWAFIGGFLEIFAAFESGETAGTRALFIIGGLVSIAFGAVLFAHPGLGAITLALLFGLFSLIYAASRRSSRASSCGGPGTPCTRSWKMRPDRPNHGH